MNIIEVEDYMHLKVESVAQFCHALKTTLKGKEEAVVAIPGGRSVRAFFEGLRETADIGADEWKRVHLFWTDERMVPPDHVDSNFKLANDLFISELLQKNYLIKEKVHRITGISLNPNEVVRDYTNELKVLGDIDIAILGVGEDGHFASIFPGSKGVHNKERGYMLVDDAPKPPRNRVSLTPTEIFNAKMVFLFFIGREKLKAYNNFWQDDVDYPLCPAKLCLESKSKIVIFRGGG
jgi:6-phosphogluconolactonase